MRTQREPNAVGAFVMRVSASCFYAFLRPYTPLYPPLRLIPPLHAPLELMQTKYDTKPLLRIEVGALGAHQVKNMRGGAGEAQICKAPELVGVGISAPAGPLTEFLF